jgi:hypothetical protein
MKHRPNLHDLIPFLIVASLLTACGSTPWATPGPTGPLGGDRDAHGCIPSAGYSWCEGKQKCLRTWEEPCSSSAFEVLTQLLAEKYGNSQKQITLTVEQQTETHARGSVRFGPKGTPGGLILAVKSGGAWRIAYEGNGAADCTALRERDAFPKDMLKGICN